MKKLILFLAAVALVGCKSEPSLQKYFVEKTEDKNFVALDLSPSVLNLDPQKLTAAQQKSIESFKKMNILAFKLTEENRDEFEIERATVDSILKDTKYQQLMKVSHGKDGGSINFIGDENKVDEFILYGSQDDFGMVVVRVLGDKMTPDDIMNFMSLLRESDMDLDQLKPLQGMFGKK